ncbi:DUF7146 domain-containing protein [Lichenihabitans psoromatis]|uniref:DUF7146 domain-containing protein n=1 Tax=Lichenihabitans psoromatis TaxID=2528642 RepID=UPI0010383C51|nr:toprim domain-containing protein [Lichenihabitans psoromatis]
MPDRLSASDLAARLAHHAEDVCRTYLRRGRKEGRYWLIGDALGSPGRSLYVRLSGPDRGKGAAGHWTDAASGQHGDLLDLIALNRGLRSTREAMDEARAFLSLPQPELPSPAQKEFKPTSRGTAEAARRLFALSRPIAGTAADLYLRHRGIDVSDVGAISLRFHPSCYYRDELSARTRTFPALIAAVTDGEGRITGVHRTWFDPDDPREKAPVPSPRRAMGELLGSGVRFGGNHPSPVPVMVAGEGIETILSLHTIMPAMPAVAALSANHLAAFHLPPTLGRLYVAVDGDRAGRSGLARLGERARQAGIEVLALVPRLGDFNEDLRRLGPADLIDHVRKQLVPQDVARFLPWRA